jgi:hypothetical protein
MMSIYHFDLNRTIVADDAAGGKDLFDAAIGLVADAEGLSEHVKTVLLPLRKGDDSHNRLIRQQRTAHWRKYAEEHPEFRAKVDALLPLMSALKPQPLFESFTSFLLHPTVQKDAIIIIRTFGSDGHVVVKGVNELVGNETFRFSADVQSRLQIWRSHAGDQLVMVGSDGNGDGDGDDVVVLAKGGAADIHKCLDDLGRQHRILLVQDDFSFWNLHAEESHAGKLVYGTNDLQQVFFDDNIPHIVDVQGVKENVRCIRVDTMSALTNSKYFINHMIL